MAKPTAAARVSVSRSSRSTGSSLIGSLAREEAMAHRQVVLLAAVVAVACLASLASSTQFMVGDDGGWRPAFNKTGWADGKTFRVGDTLMFMYAEGKHTVVQVGKEDFASCNLKGNAIKNWTTGNDIVHLNNPGKMWFFCSVPTHCDNGMKLVITVEDAAASAPAPAPPAPSSSAPTSYTVGGAVVAAGAMLAAALAF